MNSELFLSLFLVHIIGDFYLQTDKYCNTMWLNCKGLNILLDTAIVTS